MNKLALVLMIVVVPVMMAGKSFASAASQTSATPRKAVDSQILAKAKEWFYRFQRSHIDRSQLSPQVSAELTEQSLIQEAARLTALGKPSSFTFIRTYPISGAVGYDFLLQFKTDRVVEMIAFNPKGQIAGIDFETFVPTKR
jgi:hypothetical protein